MEEQDYSYFLYELHEFNKPVRTLNLKRSLDRGRTSIRGDGLVEVCCYVLMPNHYHLILRQIKDNGISKLIQKLGTGYTMFFNKKYKRKGVLFEGKYKVKPVDSDEYLMHLSRYLHLNPVSLISPDWKDEGIKEIEETREYLKNYKWSSYPAYIGLDSINRPVNKGFIMDYFKNSTEKYEKFINSWTIKDKELLDRGPTSIIEGEDGQI
jgi:putative transposase